MDRHQRWRDVATMTSSARLHFVLGAIACVLVPAASRWLGDGTFAWPMYTHSAQFRLRIVGRSIDGQSHWVAPAALAALASPRARWLFGGADRWHHGDGVRAFGPHLDELAAHACAVDAHALSIDLRLDQRDDPSAVVTTLQRTATCSR